MNGCNSVKIPWFAASWAEEFAKASITDRALLSVARMQDSMIKSIDEINAAGEPLLVISFEDSVLNPEKSIKLYGTKLLIFSKFQGIKLLKKVKQTKSTECLTPIRRIATRKTSAFWH